jgi:hypothetical protein
MIVFKQVDLNKDIKTRIALDLGVTLLQNLKRNIWTNHQNISP